MQVARVGQIDHDVLEKVRHEVLTATVPWAAEYSEYQSGGWWTASLMSENGAEDDVAIRDCEPVPTPLLVSSQGYPLWIMLLGASRGWRIGRRGWRRWVGVRGCGR
jgi:hypothetical protein